MSKQTQISTLFSRKRKEPLPSLTNEVPKPSIGIKKAHLDEPNDIYEPQEKISIKLFASDKRSINPISPPKINKNKNNLPNECSDEEQKGSQGSKLEQKTENRDHIDHSDNDNNKEITNSSVKLPENAVTSKSLASKNKGDSSQAEKRKFQEDWIKDYQGLIYDEKKDLMYCEICQKYSQAGKAGSNVFIEGTKKKTTDVLNYHWKQHKGHQAAVEASKASKNSKTSFESLVVKNETKNLILMKISYFLCKNTLSFNKFPEITHLIFKEILPIITESEKKFFNVGKHYENDDMCIQFVDSLSYVIERSILENIYKSDYYSILIDESMDITRTEQLLIYSKYFDSSKSEFRTVFLKVIDVKEQSGAQLFLAVKKYIIEKRLDATRCIAFGSDGASNMTGYKKGVFSYLQKLNPFLMLRHCANHRLALANSDTAKEINHIHEYIDIISDIYSFFSKSARRNVLLKKFQAEVMEPELSVLKMCPTRWLSLSRCVKNVSKMFQSLILTFDEELSLNDSGLTTDSREKYEKVFLKMCEYKFIGLTYFFVDILSIIDHLCLELQSNSLNYGNYVQSVNICLTEIQENYVDKEIYGDNFRAFNNQLENKDFLPHIQFDKSPRIIKETHEIIQDFSNSLLKKS